MGSSISEMRKNNNFLTEENEKLKEQINSDVKKTEQWKMLSELFREEIRKACSRYGCEEMSIL